MRARAATSANVTGCPAAASSAQAPWTRACSSWSAGIGPGDEQVEPFDEAAVAGGFLAPAAGPGVGGERFGVGALQVEDRQGGGLGAGSGGVVGGCGGPPPPPTRGPGRRRRALRRRRAAAAAPAGSWPRSGSSGSARRCWHKRRRPGRRGGGRKLR